MPERDVDLIYTLPVFFCTCISVSESEELWLRSKARAESCSGRRSRNSVGSLLDSKADADSDGPCALIRSVLCTFFVIMFRHM